MYTDITYIVSLLSLRQFNLIPDVQLKFPLMIIVFVVTDLKTDLKKVIWVWPHKDSWNSASHDTTIRSNGEMPKSCIVVRVFVDFDLCLQSVKWTQFINSLYYRTITNFTSRFLYSVMTFKDIFFHITKLYHWYSCCSCSPPGIPPLPNFFPGLHFCIKFKYWWCVCFLFPTA